MKSPRARAPTGKPRRKIALLHEFALPSLMEDNPGFFINLSALVAVLAFSVFALSVWNLRSVHPLRSLFNRWSRWFLISLVGAFLLYHVLDGTRAFFVLWLVSFLGWFLVESILTWLAVRALSHSQYPLFPRFEDVTDEGRLPASSQYLAMRDAFRKAGFTRQSLLRAELPQGLELLLMAHANEDRTIRLLTYFLPGPSGTLLPCWAFYSKEKDGSLIVTDNIFFPFGGFYPDRWDVRRYPLCRRFEGLLSSHGKRCQRPAGGLEPLEAVSAADLNEEQRGIERVNEEAGFLNAVPYREEYGLLSREGKYRLWKEIWLMNYFARPLDYRPALSSATETP